MALKRVARASVVRRVTNANPYAAIVAIASRSPRATVAVGGTVLAAGAMMLLIIASSAQAFLMISNQSTNSARNRLIADAAGESGSAPAAGSVAANVLIASGVITGGVITGGLANGTVEQLALTEAQASAVAPVDQSTISPPTGTVGPDDVESVRGIRVHRSIANDIRALLDAAEADGIILSGWGWRDSNTQIRLRREHCGTTEYAIYRMPSSKCRPPTARPGRSQHERGLAVDFTYNGGSISTRNSPGFKWLDANAAAYGLKNLASEPWHWSTTGR